MSKKILITGATGFVGSRLVSMLLNSDLELAVLVRGKHACSWPDSVKIFEGDVTKPESLKDCCHGQDVIVHLAGYAHADASEHLHNTINYQGTENLLEAALTKKVAKIVYISSSKASMESTPYGAAKYKSEKLLLAADNAGNIKVSCLRPTAVYGPGMKGNLASWMRRVKRGWVPKLPQLKTRIAMIGLDDLCLAIINMIKNDSLTGTCYQLSDGVPYNIKEIEKRIRIALGKKNNRLYFPRVVFYMVGVCGELMRKYLAINIGFTLSSYQTLFNEDFTVDNSYAEDSGFMPEQNLYTELEKIIKTI